MPESTDPLAVRRLDERIPEKGFAHPDDMLEAFLGWVSDTGVTLYRHQEEAVLEIFAGNHVVLDAPTGSGKSLVAVALLFKTFNELGRSWYTAPIKALVSEKFFALCQIFGPEHVGMMTGDGAVNRGAPIICCTAEILANLALREGDDAKVASVVMDEFHYYADRDRGMAWQIPLLTLTKSTFLLMSATLGDTRTIREDLEARTGRTVAEVRGAHRPVPLEFAYSMNPIHEALNALVREGKAPVYVVHFTQNDATEQAQALMSVDYNTKEEKKAIAEAIHGFRFHSPFGPTMRRYVLHGIGLHHAGLLPRYRLLVERLAQQGLLKIICGTDTLGVGINVPIRTVLFTQLCKFDGEKVIILRVRDFKQIAGRAGRAGFDTVGYVVAQAPEHVIENARVDARVTDPKKRRKIVKAQPPTKGYKHWDEETFRQLVERPPEPLEPHFAVDHGRLLALMQHAEETNGDAQKGYDALLALIDKSHATATQRDTLRATAETLLENLKQAGVLGHDGDRLMLDPTLQHDFTLHHSLSLFLLDALAGMDPASPTHALDVVTWVEAILEHPRQVVLRQADRAKFQLLQELKAAGVPYEDRIVALEDVTWPKPNAEHIYEVFNTYKVHHPWVSDELIRPKSVVREMAELFTSFAEYVKELGLQRSEGVLLRYLSEAYKALAQNVPAEARTDALLDVIAYLRAMLALVDSSLLTEWEQLMSGADAPAVEAVKKVDISADRRVFVARVRAELHALVRALSREDWEEAAACVKRDEAGPWGPDAFAEALAPFLEEHGAVAFDHRARLANLTTVRPVGPHQWEVRQVLVAPTKDTAQDDATRFGYADDAPEADAPSWAIEGRIDLRGDTNPEGPLVTIVAIAG
jgi:superfamily II RNA helicase